MEKLNQMYEKMTVSDDVVARAVDNAKKPRVIRFPWQAVAGVVAAAVLVVAVTAFVVPMAFGSLLRTSGSDTAARADASPQPLEEAGSGSDSASGSTSMTSVDEWERVKAYASPVEHTESVDVYGGAYSLCADEAYYDGEMLYISYRGHIEDYPDGVAAYVYDCYDDDASAICVNGTPTAPFTGEFVLTLTDGELFGVLELYVPGSDDDLEITTDFPALNALDGDAALSPPAKERYTVHRSPKAE